MFEQYFDFDKKTWIFLQKLQNKNIFARQNTLVSEKGFLWSQKDHYN